MYLDQYHGETQWESPKVTTQFGYDSDDEEFAIANRVYNHFPTEHQVEGQTGTFREVGPSEYFIPCQEDDDADKVIASWLMEN